MEDDNKHKVISEILSIIPRSLFPKKSEKPVLELFLEKDLGIYGDDAAEFMERYFESFNVDDSNFDLSDYFTKETPFYLFKKYICGIKAKDLQIKDLVNGVIEGRLE